MSMYCIVFTPSYLPIALVVQVEMGQASLSVVQPYLPIALVVQVEMGQASLSVCPVNNFSRT